MFFLFRVLSRCPLWLLHGLGVAAGWLAFALSASYRRVLRENLALAGLRLSQVRAAVGAAGCMVLELPRLWFGAPVAVAWRGREHVEQAVQLGRGVVFLTPHLGCFEITAQAYAQQFGARQPITVLYRPARKRWLQALVERARQRPGLRTAPTTLAGVKQMLKALHAGQCVGLLPDQVPPLGLGVWAPFFGRSAYTMTLGARLARQTGATVLLAWGERLPWGQGYVVHVQPLDGELDGGVQAGAEQINQAMEALVRQAPQQYLWGYARYKEPRQERSA